MDTGAKTDSSPQQEPLAGSPRSRAQSRLLAGCITVVAVVATALVVIGIAREKAHDAKVRAAEEAIGEFGGYVGITNRHGFWHVHLGETKVDDGALEQLRPHLEVLQPMAYIRINSTAITDAGLAHLPAMPSLDWVDLCNTRVTEQGARALHARIPWCRISYGSPEATRQIEPSH